MKKIFIGLVFLLFSSCYNEDDFSPSELSKIMNLKVENDNQIANGVNKIRIIAEFPSDFTTEDDNKVKFVIQGKNTTEVLADIRLIEDNGTNQKIAETNISSTDVESLNVKAIISINESEISKNVNISFQRALCESIKMMSSSLTVKPSSFDEIIINTNLERKVGIVSAGTLAETKIVDINGITRGILVNYNNKADSTGKIVNHFTMGNDSYQGKLYIISESIDENNNPIKNTLIIYSQN